MNCADIQAHHVVFREYPGQVAMPAGCVEHLLFAQIAEEDHLEPGGTIFISCMGAHPATYNIGNAF